MRRTATTLLGLAAFLASNILPLPSSAAPEGSASDPPQMEQLRQLDFRMHKLLDAGNFDSAVAVLHEFVQLSDEMFGADYSETAAKLTWVATQLNEHQRYAQAEPLFREALAMQEREKHPIVSDLATTLNNLGMSLESRSLWAQAEPYLVRAKDIYESTAPGSSEAAQSEHNLGICYYVQGKYADAEQLFRHALTVREWEPLKAENGAVSSAIDLSRVLASEGNYEEAQSLLSRAAVETQALPASHDKDLRSAMLQEAMAFDLDEQGRFAEALSFERSLLTAMEAQYGLDSAPVAAGMVDLASHLRRLGKDAEADGMLQTAHAIGEKLKGRASAFTIGMVNSAMAQALDQRHQYKDAEQHWRNYLTMLDGDPVLHATGKNYPLPLRSLAENLDAQGRFAEAQTYYQKALDTDTRVFGPDALDTASSLDDLGQFLTGHGDPAEAVKLLRQAAAIRSGSVLGNESAMAEEDRPSWLSRSSYSLLAESLWSWHANGGGAAAGDRPDALRDEAFVAAQRAARNSSAMSLARAQTRISAPTTELGRISRARETLVLEQDALRTREVELIAQQNLPALGDLRARLDALQTELTAKESDLKNRYPEYWTLISPDPLRIEDLQAGTCATALLHCDEAFIQILQTDKDVLVFAVTKDGTAWAKADLSSAGLDLAVSAVRCSIDSFGCSGGGVTHSFDRTAAFKLYQALFGSEDVKALLASKPNLLVVTNLALTVLPLGVLVTQPPTGDDDDPQALRDTHWLVKDKAIAMLPDIASLRTLRASRKKHDTPDPFLGFAPEFDGTELAPDAADNTAQAHIRSVRSLPPLNTADEVETMKKDLGGQAFPGSSASEAAVRALDASGRLARTRILAFATHGLVRGQFDLSEPALALSPPDSGASASLDNDGLLTASEITGLRIGAEWVVLSACNTASAFKPGGDGFSGLSRAFFYAGARSLLVSHWRIRDDAAAFLVDKIVALQRTDPQLTRAQALQQAELALLADTHLDNTTASLSHPSAWAPFSFIGQ